MICRSLSVFDNIYFEVADVIGFLDKLVDRCTQIPDGIPSIMLRKFAAPHALPLCILINESLKTCKCLLNGKMHMLFS